MSEPFIGEIRIFGGNFPPRGWALCNGQLLSISQNTALFSLLGTFYGGNGQSTFALPDLRGRVPVHQGGGYDLGEVAGAETVALNQNQIPAHSHTVAASTATPPAAGTGVTLTDSQLYVPGQLGKPRLYTADAPNVAMSPQAVAIAGGGLPHNNMAPYLAITYIIALEGIYPQRP